MSNSTNSTRKYIFIGDSYGTDISGNDGWIQTLATLAKLTVNVDYYSSSEGGAGFVAGTTFQSQITSLSTSIADKTAITDIVVCGGWNDITASNTIVDEKNAITNFIKHCNENYPNATVRIGYIGWARLNGSKLNEYNGRLYYRVSEMIEAFQTIEGKDYVYLNGIENVLSSSLTYIYNGVLKSDGTPDYLHTTVAGTKILAKKIWEAIQTGSCDVTVGTKQIPVTYTADITETTPLKIFTTVKNGMRQIYFSNFDLTFSPGKTITGNGLDSIHIATLDVTEFGSFNGTENTCKIFSSDSYIIGNGAALAGTLSLWIEEGGKVKLGFKPTMTVNDSVTITKAYMCSPHIVTVPLIQT